MFLHRTCCIAASLALRLLSATSPAQTLYNDNFDIDTSADWNIISSGDTAVEFAFDYSVLGIPPSPGSSSTMGLRLRAHLEPTIAVHAVTLASDFQVGSVPSGGYRLEFYAWQNHTNLSIQPPGSAGQTQYLTCGVGHDRQANNFAGNVGPTGMTPETGSGAWYAATGDAGANRDFVAFNNGVEQLASLAPGTYPQLTQNGGVSPFPILYPRISVGSINGGALASAQGLSPGALTPIGSLGFGWRRWHVDVGENSATWFLDSNLVDTVEIAHLVDGVNGDITVTGAISIGYMDIFNSTTGLPDLHFAIIDNLSVSVIPETASSCFVTFAGVLCIGRRRSFQK